MSGTPRAIQVITHTKKAAKLGATIDRNVYRFLNNALDEGEISAHNIIDLRKLKCLYDVEQQRSVRPRDCYSKKHPFGLYRVLLPTDTLSTYTHFLSALDVRPEPSWEDAVDVISEISQGEDVRSKRRVSNADKDVLLACWRLIETALHDEDTDRDDVLRKLEELSAHPIVCRADNLVVKPVNVFFRDREHLAEAFSSSINVDLIPMPQGATESLARAGVRKLSEVTKTTIIPNEMPPLESFEVKNRINERAPLLISVMETCHSSQQSATSDFDAIKVSESGSLTVQHTFCGYAKPLPPVHEPVLAIMDESQSQLWYCLEDGDIPWDAIACEIARMCLGSNDIPQLSAQISAVLEPESLKKAERKLSHLGFPTFELTDENSHVDSAAIDFGLGGECAGEDSAPPERAAITGTSVVSNAAIEEQATVPSSNNEPEPANTTRTGSASVASDASPESLGDIPVPTDRSLINDRRGTAQTRSGESSTTSSASDGVQDKDRHPQEDVIEAQGT